MKPAARLLFLVYVAIVAPGMLLILLQRDELRWITKPLLVLLFYWFAKRGAASSSSLVFTALFLSWCGNVLLLAKGLFIPGLAAFLLALLFIYAQP